MEDKKIEQFTNNIILLFPIYHKNLIKTEEKCSLITPTNPQIKVLGMLAIHGPMPMSTISKKLCVTKPNITGLIDKLIEEKLVDRHHDEKDRRIITISLSEKGKQYLIKSKNETKKVIKKNLSILSEKDFNKLVKASEDMIQILSKLNNEEYVSKARNIIKN